MRKKITYKPKFLYTCINIYIKLVFNYDLFIYSKNADQYPHKTNLQAFFCYFKQSKIVAILGNHQM